ncbi:hypothetical protein PC116_g33220 [Phytophthora cactorum]|nr:hypothetical protein PC116_g33220 [Phytophthora cactorum]
MIGCRLGSEDSVSSDQSITFESSFYPSSVFAPVPPSATSLPPPHTSFVSKTHTFYHVSLSTSEAEYIALSLAIQEGKWIHRLLCEILAATNETGPELKIREDNQSCIKMTKNPVNHGRAKHIDIKYHHIRDEVKRGEVKLQYCETSVMLADIMTKALAGPRHTDLTVALGIHACSH